MNKKLLLAMVPALLGSAAANAQLSVNTGGKKHVVIEESTGAWCGYCPDGALVLNNILAANPNAIGVSIHGGGTDAMRFADGDALTSQYYTAFPLGMVDRYYFNTPGNASYEPAQSRNMWSGQVTTRLAVAPDFDVYMDHGFDQSTGVVKVRVSTKALKAVTGNYNINVYVVEDSVTGTGSGWDQHNYYSSTGGAAGGSSHPYYNLPPTIVGWVHMHVVRAILGGVNGTTGKITPNAPANSWGSMTYTYTVPSTSNWKHMKLVAVVLKDNPSDKKDRAINNAIEAKLTVGTLGVSNVTPALTNVQLSPNPAVNTVRIEGTTTSHSTTSMTLVNAVGQVIMEKTYNAGQVNDNIDVSRLSNGVYYLNLVSDAGRNSEKLVIAH